MADVFIIRNVTQALLEILKQDLAPILPPASIIAAPPEEAANVSTQTLIVYLYQALESTTLKNSGPRAVWPAPSGSPPTQGPAVIESDPVAVDLYYLLIPTAPSSPETVFLDTYAVLGAAMRSFHRRGIFRLGEFLPSAPVADKDLEFRIGFNPLSTGELFELWEAVNEPYRLSVSYVVRTARIDADQSTAAPLVSERRMELL